jgi:hypothetical protein
VRIQQHAIVERAIAAIGRRRDGHIVGGSLPTSRGRSRACETVGELADSLVVVRALAVPLRVLGLFASSSDDRRQFVAETCPR